MPWKAVSVLSQTSPRSCGIVPRSRFSSTHSRLWICFRLAEQLSPQFGRQFRGTSTRWISIRTRSLFLFIYFRIFPSRSIEKISFNCEEKEFSVKVIQIVTKRSSNGCNTTNRSRTTFEKIDIAKFHEKFLGRKMFKSKRDPPIRWKNIQRREIEQASPLEAHIYMDQEK